MLQVALRVTGEKRTRDPFLVVNSRRVGVAASDLSHTVSHCLTLSQSRQPMFQWQAEVEEINADS